MVFSSIKFLLYFLPIFLVLYGITPKSCRNLTLLIGSIIFYTLGDPHSLLLLLLSMGVNYFIGLYLVGRREGHRKVRKKRKALLTAAIIGNVGMLALFKFAPGGLELPLGISFYTFQVLSYLLDVYRGEIRREMSFLKFAVYISMFPQLISGPIVYYSEVSAQLESREFTAEGIQEGLKVFIMGLVSKVLLADRVGILWTQVQTTGFESISTPLAWLAAVAYSLKLYFDFYGYSLMGIGLGRMLGFELPENFKEPYMALGVRDFYRRWHMTLGRWFRKYVYIPLGGNRGTEGRTILNLLVVWVLPSLWHGKTLNFLVWGLGLWLLIVFERQLGRLKWMPKLRVLPRLYLWAVIPVTWMCFEITDLSQLEVYLGRMFGFVQGINVYARDWYSVLSDYGGLLLICFVACTPLVRKLYGILKDRLIGMVALGTLFWVCVWRIIVEGENIFTYFHF